MTHEIVLRSGPDPRPFRGGKALLLSCTCRRVRQRGRPVFEPIEARTIFPAADAKAAWRAWHEEQGVTV